MKLFATIFSLLFFFCGFIFGQNTQYENHIIDKIDVTLVNVTNDADLSAVRARMKTKAGAHFSQADFDNDLKCLVADFDRVEPRLEIVGDKFNISLKVWPKPTIRTIQWERKRRSPPENCKGSWR